VRLQRALTQRIIIVGFTETANASGWRFQVLGTQGVVYSVDIGANNTFSCSCPDFSGRHMGAVGVSTMPCKHIFLTAVRALHQPTVGHINAAALPQACRNYVAWRQQQLQQYPMAAAPAAAAAVVVAAPAAPKAPAPVQAAPGPGPAGPPQVPRKAVAIDPSCVICMEDMEEATVPGAEPLSYCGYSCGRPYHATCLSSWRSKNTTCPMCRAELGPPTADGNAAKRARVL